MKEKEIIYMRESALQSIVSDTFTFGCIFGLLYFNHKVLNQSTVIDVLFILMTIALIIGRQSKHYKRFTSHEELLKYLTPVKAEAQNVTNAEQKTTVKGISFDG